MDELKGRRRWREESRYRRLRATGFALQASREVAYASQIGRGFSLAERPADNPIDDVRARGGSMFSTKQPTRPQEGGGEVLRCSFCNENQREVRKLIAGPNVFICDECVEVCVDIIAQDVNLGGSAGAVEAGRESQPAASDSSGPQRYPVHCAACRHLRVICCRFVTGAPCAQGALAKSKRPPQAASRKPRGVFRKWCRGESWLATQSGVSRPVRRQSWPGSSRRAQLGGPRIRPLRRPGPRLAFQCRP